MVCQQLKVGNWRLGGRSQEIELLVWKGKMINMDFVTSLLRSQNKCDSIPIIVDRIIKSAHYFPMRTNYAGGIMRHCSFGR